MIRSQMLDNDHSKHSTISLNMTLEMANWKWKTPQIE